MNHYSFPFSHMLSIHSDYNFLSSLYTDISFGDTGVKNNKAVLHSRGRSHRKLRQYRRSLTMPGGNDIQDWFKSLPIFTRYWLGITDNLSSSENDMFYKVWTDGSLHSSRSVLPSQPSVVDPVLGNIHHKVNTTSSSRDRVSKSILLNVFLVLHCSTIKLICTCFFFSFHVWRPVTCLFFYPLSPKTGFHFLINLYFLYNYRYIRTLGNGCGVVCPTLHLFIGP